MENKVSGLGVTVATSSRLEALTDCLARDLGDKPSDPFTSDLIVVPNIGVRDWLQRELCTRLDGGRAGIVANVRFVFAQQFLDQVFRASGSPTADAWDIDHLTWAVHRAIDAIGRSSVPGASSKPLTVARVIADLFDRYGVHRPSMLHYWRQGRAVDAVEPLQDLGDHLAWQQRLYVEVCGQIEQDSPIDRIARLRESVRMGTLAESVPNRIALFGFVTVNTTMRLAIDALGTDRAIGVYLVHPRQPGPTGNVVAPDRLVAREHNSLGGARNSLATRWGRAALETSDVLSGRWMSVDGEEPDSVSYLSRLRRAIVSDDMQESVTLDDRPEDLAHGDGSIQVHACHGRLRQVEVLRDALMHLLVDDPTLTLADISIQCPDLTAFAPIIAAVFRSGMPSTTGLIPALDVKISDRTLVGENPYHDAFWTLLDLARSRCGVGDVLSALSAPPVRRRFALDDDSLDRGADWFEALAVRFGLDSHHRRTWGIPDRITRGTWDEALDRLYMGLALPAESPFSGPGGVVPFDDISVTEASELARLSDFLERLGVLVRQFGQSHSVGEWAAIFTSVMREFFDESESRDFFCRDLDEAIENVSGAAERAGIDPSESFAFEEIAALLEGMTTSTGTRPRFRTGAITVTDVLPQQGVPYRVIALLGASEEMFTSGSVRGDDVLHLRPCVGDPMPSASGRLQLLSMMLSARDCLIVTCDGADINTNTAIPLPVPIQELLEAAVAVRPRDAAGASARASRRCNLLTRHPRQSYSPRNFVPGLVRSDRPFTFDPVALRVHELRSEPPTPILASRCGVAIGDSDRVTADSLRRVLGRPADHFVRDVLKIRLPDFDGAGQEDVLEFWPSPLDLARVGRELLSRVLESTQDPQETLDRCAPLIALEGAFPPGALAEAAVAKVRSEVEAIIALVPDGARRLIDHASIDIDHLEIPGPNPFVVHGVVANVVGFDLARTSFTRFRDHHVLEPWIDLALASYVSPENPWTVRLVARGPKGKGISKSFTLAGTDAEERRDVAARILCTARAVMEAMSRGRVPYLPSTAYALAQLSRDNARSIYESEDEYSTSVEFLFGRVPWDEFIGESVAEGDPNGPETNRAERFANFIWREFDATTVMVDNDGVPR